MRTKSLTLFFVSMFLKSGCSAFKPDKQTMNITCNIPDTVLKVNGDRYDCPAKVDVLRNKLVLVEAKKEGYDPYTKAIDNHFSSEGKWDLVGTVVWFFPVFGLINAGAWDLDQTDLYIQLYPLSQK